MCHVVLLWLICVSVCVVVAYLCVSCVIVAYLWSGVLLWLICVPVVLL